MTQKNVLTILVYCLLVSTGILYAQTPTPSGKTPETSRDPFTVKLQFNDKHVEQKFDKTPYVSEKTIYIFPGEEFGINVKREGEAISEISYQPDLFKADVTFKFEVRNLDKESKMMLTVESNLDKMLLMEGWMLLPGGKEPVKTSLAPLFPQLMGVESWPQPIVELQLKNLRLAASPKGLAGTRQ